MNDINVSAPNGSSQPASERGLHEEKKVLLAERTREARQLPSQEWYDFTSGGCLLTDLHGVVHGTNLAAAKLLGTRREFLLGKPLGLFVAADSHAAFYERLARLATCSDVEQWETRLSRPPGQPRQIELTVMAHAAEDGMKLSWALRDVTELRQAQRQALRVERLAAIGQTAASLAHEGRNALQRIQACLTLLTLRLQGQRENLDLLGRIQRASDDLQRLFDDVRSCAVAPRLQRRPHDLRPIWREAWNDLAGLPEWRFAELCEEVNGVDTCCSVDPPQLKQVFRNLLENALSCGANPVRVVLGCRPASLGAEDAIRLRLRDNGPGIPAEICPRLFEPFFTTKARGTGLGLAICKRIVEAHGGQLEANGDCAEGAEMVLVLPRRGT